MALVMTYPRTLEELEMSIGAADLSNWMWTPHFSFELLLDLIERIQRLEAAAGFDQ